MNESRIRSLLEGYFEGETTPEEERELKAYFAEGDNVTADLEYAGAMFGYFDQAAGEKGGAWKQPKATFSLSRARRIAVAISAAAAVAIVVTTGLVRIGAPRQTVYCYINGKSVTDYETARACTQKALGIISESLQKPLEYIAPGGEINAALKTLESLSIVEQQN